MAMTQQIGTKPQGVVRAGMVVAIGCLISSETALGQRIQFFPIRSAPLGSPVGTVGDPVTPTFNDDLGCWELLVPPGVEVDLDLQGGGWGYAPGPPSLGVIQATVMSAGYSNGIGADLKPKGWPDSPHDGAYVATGICDAGGDGSPCSPPFDGSCGGNGFCVVNQNLVIWVWNSSVSIHTINVSTLDYSWGSGALGSNHLDPDPLISRSFGGLILEVPVDAAGTYVIAPHTDPNKSFMTAFNGPSIPIVDFIPACLTIVAGACCLDSGPDHGMEACRDNLVEPQCDDAGGLFLGHDSSCSGIVGACCLNQDGDQFAETCMVADQICCHEQGGSFLGAATTCGDGPGACTLDSNGDGFQDTCHMLDETCCGARHGTYRGAGVACSETVGACCLDGDRVCVEIDLTNCVEQNGNFQGHRTACAGDDNSDGLDDGCGEVIPAASEWGLIVMTLLLLVGIKISFASRHMRPAAMTIKRRGLRPGDEVRR